METAKEIAKQIIELKYSPETILSMIGIFLSLLMILIASVWIVISSWDGWSWNWNWKLIIPISLLIIFTIILCLSIWNFFVIERKIDFLQNISDNLKTIKIIK